MTLVAKLAPAQKARREAKQENQAPRPHHGSMAANMPDRHAENPSQETGKLLAAVYCWNSTPRNAEPLPHILLHLGDTAEPRLNLRPIFLSRHLFAEAKASQSNSPFLPTFGLFNLAMQAELD